MNDKIITFYNLDESEKAEIIKEHIQPKNDYENIDDYYVAPDGSIWDSEESYQESCEKHYKEILRDMNKKEPLKKYENYMSPDGMIWSSFWDYIAHMIETHKDNILELFSLSKHIKNDAKFKKSVEDNIIDLLQMLTTHNGLTKRTQEIIKKINEILSSLCLDYIILPKKSDLEETILRKANIARENSQKICIYYNDFWAICRDGKVRTTTTDKNLSKKIEKLTGLKTILVDHDCIAGVKKDGTIFAQGRFELHKCRKWKDIKSLYSDFFRLYGVTTEGNVVCSEPLHYACTLKNIVSINGSVALNGSGKIERITGWCSDWEGLEKTGDIISADNFSVYSGSGTVLYSNGKVAAINMNGCNVSEWEYIIAIASNSKFIVGLTLFGDVVTTDERFKSEVSTWRNVSAIAASQDFIVGVTNDGKILSTSTDILRCTLDWRVDTTPIL